MRITPRDIQEKEFGVAFRGYKEEEVDTFLDDVTEAYETVFKENMDMKEEVERLREECKKYETLGERMQAALLAAQETAEEVKRGAQREADSVLREAEIKAQKLLQTSRDQHRELKRTLATFKQVEDEFRFKLKSMLQSYSKLLDEIAPIGERKEIKSLLLPEEEEEEIGVAAREETREEMPVSLEEEKVEPEEEKVAYEAPTSEEAEVAPEATLEETVAIPKEEEVEEVKLEEKLEEKEEKKVPTKVRGRAARRQVQKTKSEEKKEKTEKNVGFDAEIGIEEDESFWKDT